jgi:hypothetical protein
MCINHSYILNTLLICSLYHIAAVDEPHTSGTPKGLLGMQNSVSKKYFYTNIVSNELTEC